MRSASLFVLGLVPALLAGCVAKTGSPNDSSQVGVHSYCAETECQQAYDACTSASESECSTCYDECDSLAASDSSLVTECLSTCDETCSQTSSCTDNCSGNSPCADTEYKVVLPSTVDQSVLEACQAWNKHVKACGIPAGMKLTNCRVASRAFASSMASTFSCEARQSCSATSDSCTWPTGNSKIGEKLCSMCNGSNQCAGGGAASLDQIDSWLVPSMQRALASCLNADSCSNQWSCVDALLTPLFS